MDPERHRADELVRVVRVILTYVGNIVAFPSEMKYRKVMHYRTKSLGNVEEPVASGFRLIQRMSPMKTFNI